MPRHFCDHCDHQPQQQRPAYRTMLWIALTINGTMFTVEVMSSLRSESMSLLADSLDFLGDTANYGISLVVLRSSTGARARASRVKAASMLAFGVWILGLAAWHFLKGQAPSVPTMGVVGTSALLANGVVAGLLFRFRTGDSNIRSVWLCTRSDMLGNLAVLVAALGVLGTESKWPDLAIAAFMSTLAITSAANIFRRSGAELRDHAGERHSAARP